MRNLLPLLLLLSLLAACTDDRAELLPDTTATEPMTREAINERIWQELHSGKVFDWQVADENMLYSASMLSDSIYAIGYQPAGYTGIEDRIHTIDLRSPEWTAARERVYDIVLQGEREARNQPELQIEDLLPFGEARVLPQMSIQITNRATLTRLRELPELRYLEPMGYYFEPEGQAMRSSSGCGVSPDYNLPLADYTPVAPNNAKVPWNFYLHNIPTAWNTTTGDNIKVAIIDTGSSDSQDNLRSNFNSGYSSGRSVQAVSTKYSGSWWWKSLDSPNDDCGHGTQMSGLATGPRSNDGNSVGVAYNADLKTFRAVEDVIISSSNEKNGVKDALIAIGNDSSIKIASMSIGTPFSSGTVQDGIYYAYNNGKLLIAAAGTSTSFTNWYGVIFPATMSQTVAVTGVKEGSSLQRCNTCHSGDDVDFVITMQRSFDNDRVSLTLSTSTNQPTYVSGSSAATATTAGIAALVWSTNPSQSRNQVLQKLKNASQFYPARDGDYGWGRIDAAAAVIAQ